MKTEGMAKQIEALSLMADTRWFALFMQQGTGKTWTFLADAEDLYGKGKVDSVLVIAPSGVHENWVLREIPKHLSVPHVAHYWSPNPGKARRYVLQRDLLTLRAELRILTVNYEAVARSKDAFDFVADFLQSSRALMILDESQRIKDTTTSTYKKTMELRDFAIARRIGTGTPMDKPQDIFGQMQFLKAGLLGTNNYRAFMSEYTRLVDPARTMLGHPERPTSEDYRAAAMVKNNPRMRYAIQVARDEITGLPMYRNLDRLRKLVGAHSFRCLKTECLDLPPKVFQTQFFHLSPKQRAAYALLEDELRVQARDGELLPIHKLAKFTKLQQITSGYVMVPGDPEPVYIGDDNPRLHSLIDRMKDIDGQKIVWCRFREELASLARLFRDSNISFVEYHGDVKKKDRNTNLDSFQAGEQEVFLGVQKAGGVGLTITAASTTFFCSNEYSAIIRDQAEDRNHRRGSEIHESVLYIDMAAIDTIDQSITRAFQEKLSLAATILGDRNIDMSGVNEQRVTEDDLSQWLGESETDEFVG
ncbi:MAG TPA: DEAD/DEAH box helicase [Abditibacteriaceae bacterium]